MPESLNTGKVYEKGKDYFSFYIDCCWLSSGGDATNLLI